MLIYLIFVFEALSFFTSLIIYKARKVPLYLKFFPIFLFIIVIQDITSYTIKGKSVYYYPIINAYTVFEFAFYSFILYQLVQANRIKVVIPYIIILYSFAALGYNLEMGNGFAAPIYILGSLIIVCFCMYYFYEFFKNPVRKNPVQEPTFWICLGLMFFKSCTIPLFGIYNYLGFSSIENNLIDLILGISNYFLYGSYIIAFICFNRIRIQCSSETNYA